MIEVHDVDMGTEATKFLCETLRIMQLTAKALMRTRKKSTSQMFRRFMSNHHYWRLQRHMVLRMSRYLTNSGYLIHVRIVSYPCLHENYPIAFVWEEQ